MPPAKSEFTNVSSLRSEALGQPGQRTFRILVDSGSSSAIIWLEKEQLFQLALAIHQLLATLAEEEEKEASGTPPPDREAPELTHLDLKSGRMVLGHDGSRGLFIIDAHDIEDDDEETATVRVWANKDQVNEFAEQSLQVCAAGRSLCPLCGRPIDPDGHRCPRVNGRVQISSL